MGSCEKVRLSAEEIQEVDKFNYLGLMISTDGGTGEEGVHRMVEGDDGKVVEREHDICRSKTGDI